MPLMVTGADGVKRVKMRVLPNGTRVPILIFPNPRDTVNWRSDIKSAALAVFDGGNGLLTGPLRMDVTYYIQRPQSMIWKKRPMPVVPCTAGPDRSNVMKSLEDALQGVVYANDKQLADGRVRKMYCAGPGCGDVRPRTEVVISEA